MPLKIYISNDIENLAGKLADSIKNNPVDLFQKEYIVIQTEGMSKWLSVKIAEKNGIFSNFAFFSPNDILFELFKSANIHTSDIFNVNNLRWLIYNILESNDFKSKFALTYQYFEDDKIKQLQLATKLADLYDQYTIYRPDYIRLWNENKPAKVKQTYIYHEKWQRWIWNKIKAQTGKYELDKVQVRDKLLEKISGDDKFIRRLKSAFTRISLFGFSIFTPFHLEVFLGKLTQYIDIDFYLFNPAPQDYWLQDIPEKTKVRIENRFKKSAGVLNLTVGNNLLMNLGKTAKNLYLMLFENEQFINSMDNESLVNVPQKTSLLKTIQNDIYYNINNDNRKKIAENTISDGSITVTSNYSMVREVEVLYNYLLKQIQEYGYKPADIIIQTTNIDAYTPYIKAVFDNAPVRLPYAIADRTFAGTDNLVGIIKQILSLHKDEFTSENIIQLLEIKEIGKKFGIVNIAIVRKLIEKANIRHGIEGNKKDNTFLVSWKFGLERILLGYAMIDDSLYAVPNEDYKTLPLENIEGEYAIEGLKLINFVNRLIKFLNERNIARTLDQWRVFITDFIMDIMIVPDDKTDELNYILNKLAYPDIIDELLKEKFGYDIFSRAFIDSLYINKRSGKFISGRITFCSMIPMRSIPYRVVGILGLNQGVFPAKTRETGFDLILSEVRRGDRNSKDAEKYLFLESLLSAKEKFYLSFIGQNIKDNTDIPPATVVDELSDYIKFALNEETDRNLIIKHPLHNFNRKYFDPHFEEYYTFLDYGKDMKTPSITRENNLQIQEIDNIDIKKLTGFYKDPIKWYFNNILKIYYNDEGILLPESEVFEIDNLHKYFLKSVLLKNTGDDIDEDFIFEEMIKGNLPLKNFAVLELNNINSELQNLKEKYQKEISGLEEKNVFIEKKLESGTMIYGEINDIWGDKLIIPLLSKNRAKYIVILQLYRWICAIAGLPVKNFVLLSNDNKNDLRLEAIDKNKAQNYLSEAIEYFKSGYTSIPVFYPSASFSYTKLRYKPGRSRKDPLEAFIEYFDVSHKEDTKHKNEKLHIDPYLEKLSKEKYYEQFSEREEEIDKIGKLFFEEII